MRKRDARAMLNMGISKDRGQKDDFGTVTLNLQRESFLESGTIWTVELPTFRAPWTSRETVTFPWS